MFFLLFWRGGRYFRSRWRRGLGLVGKEQFNRDAIDDAQDARLLQIVKQQFVDNPQDIVPADIEQLRRIGKLVKDVELD